MQQGYTTFERLLRYWLARNREVYGSQLRCSDYFVVLLLIIGEGSEAKQNQEKKQSR
ncbi:MAG: hypothetical protein NVS1B11_35100 [Terriglobales bacterium]